MRVNGLDCEGAEKKNVLSALVNGSGWVHLMVRRRRCGGRSLHTVQLDCTSSNPHGLSLHTGVYIANILQASPAAREANLAIGDRVLNVSVDCILIIPIFNNFYRNFCNYTSVKHSKNKPLKILIIL